MIFAHIAGLNTESKKNITNTFKNSNIIFKDLEDYTDKILNDKNMKALIQRYEYYFEKSKSQGVTKIQAKEFLNKAKVLERKINFYWKNKMNFYILDLINEVKPSQKIILIGYSNFFKNNRIFVNIQTNLKFFVQINPVEHVKEVIKFNLETYSNDIINGSFNLDFLNYQFLIKKREIISSLYLKNGYQVKTIDNIIRDLQLNNQNIDNIIPNVLYFSSKTNYTNKINLKKIIAYSYDWISIVSAFNNKNLIKGFQNDIESKPFIQEITKNTINKLQDSIYLYVINDVSSFIPIFSKNYIYKFRSNKPVTIYKQITIDNVYSKLKEMKIKLILKK